MMAENVTSELIYETLIALRNDVKAMREEMRGSDHRLDRRLLAIEAQRAENLTHMGDLYQADVAQRRELSDFRERLERIERRLELSE
jgi:hypothetical protein